MHFQKEQSLGEEQLQKQKAEAPHRARQGDADRSAKPKIDREFAAFPHGSSCPGRLSPPFQPAGQTARKASHLLAARLPFRGKFTIAISRNLSVTLQAPLSNASLARHGILLTKISRWTPATSISEHSPCASGPDLRPPVLTRTAGTTIIAAT